MKSCLICANNKTCSKAKHFENYILEDCSEYSSKVDISTLVWNVVLYDYKADHVTTYNIFKNVSFQEDCEELFSTPNLGKEIFEDFLDRKAMYAFWGRCEYEYLISSWPPGPEETPYKIDVYEQLKINWSRFVDYLYDLYMSTLM